VPVLPNIIITTIRNPQSALHSQLQDLQEKLTPEPKQPFYCHILQMADTADRPAANGGGYLDATKASMVRVSRVLAIHRLANVAIVFQASAVHPAMPARDGVPNLCS
jgi:hypothetical protein